MQFSKDTISILKNFATINPAIRLIPGNLVMTCNQATTNYAHAEIPDVIDLDCAISDVNGFLNIVQLVGDNATITQEGNQLAISSPRSVTYWPLVEPDAILTPRQKANFPAGTVEFELNSDDWQQFTRVSRALGVDVLAIVSDDNKIKMRGYNRLSDADFESPLVSVDLSDYQETHKFKFILRMENMKIPVDNYLVKIFAKGSQIASCFEGKLSTHLIALEKSSTHNFE